MSSVLAKGCLSGLEIRPNGVIIISILISKLNYLGDAATFLPTLKFLSDYFSKENITVICTPVGRQVFEGCNNNLDFVEIKRGDGHHKNIKDIFQIIKTYTFLRNIFFSASLHSYDEPSISYLLTVMLRIQKRIGYRSLVAKAQNILTDYLPFDISRNVVDINFDLARYVSNNESIRPLRIPITHSISDYNHVMHRLAHFGLSDEIPYIIIHTGAKYQYRKWSNKNFIELSKRLEKSLRLPVIFVFEKKDEECFNHVKYIEGITVKQMACLFSMATIFIGHNSGPMHVAGAMGTPSIIIQGPSALNWDFFWTDIPYRIIKASNVDCMPCEKLIARNLGICGNNSYPMSCMKNITVDEVQLITEKMFTSMKISISPKHMPPHIK